MKKRALKGSIIVLALALLLATYASMPFLHQYLSGPVTINPELLGFLDSLESVSAKTGEKCVDAVLVYQGKVIGQGHSVQTAANGLLDHAEINALRDAYNSYTYEGFKRLNRDSLVLLTTLEPCMMCQGVLKHYNITRVHYTRPKKFSVRFTYWKSHLHYHLKVKKIRRDSKNYQ